MLSTICCGNDREAGGVCRARRIPAVTRLRRGERRQRPAAVRFERLPAPRQVSRRAGTEKHSTVGPTGERGLPTQPLPRRAAGSSGRGGEQLQQIVFRQHGQTELLRFHQLAAGVGAGDNVIGLP